jgi:hypothetical protein
MNNIRLAARTTRANFPYSRGIAGAKKNCPWLATKGRAEEIYW